MIISGINLQTLHESLPIFGSCLSKMGAPAGVQLALLIMERCSPKKFFQNFKTEPKYQEGLLQLLIAAARTFPSSEIDAIRGTQLAFEAMKNSKRTIRQGALEALASLAQVAGNFVILETVASLAQDFGDSERILGVVRTRLSRRQLPTVDLNGKIRYSSPREQEELNWLCGGSPVLKKTETLNSIPVHNYWKHNAKRYSDNDEVSAVSI